MRNILILLYAALMLAEIANPAECAKNGPRAVRRLQAAEEADTKVGDGSETWTTASVRQTGSRSETVRKPMPDPPEEPNSITNSITFAML
jgi:hypothetical protein